MSRVTLPYMSSDSKNPIRKARCDGKNKAEKHKTITNKVESPYFKYKNNSTRKESRAMKRDIIMVFEELYLFLDFRVGH